MATKKTKQALVREKIVDRATRVLDGYVNVLTGLGLQGKDKRESTQFNLNITTAEEAALLWVGSDLAAKAIEKWPEEMFRAGWTIDCPDDQSKADEIREIADKLNVDRYLKKLAEYSRAYGGGGILLGANDGAKELSNPLGDRIFKFDWLTLFEPCELNPAIWQDDPTMPDFGSPKLWQVAPQTRGGAPAQFGTNIHASRFVLDYGIQVTRSHSVQYQYQGFGHNVLTRIARVLRDFNLSWESATILLQDFAQGVFKIKGLAELFAADETEVVQNKFAAMSLSKSVVGSLVIDSEEDFERKSTPMTGLPEMLDRFEARLAAAIGMPITVLMGRSPGGLNATGESDLQIFYDSVRAKQQHELKPKISKIVDLLFKANGGENLSWEIKFNSLKEPTAKEIAEQRHLVAQADAIYVQNAIVSPEEIAASRWGGNAYSPEMALETGLRAEMNMLDQDGDDSTDH